VTPEAMALACVENELVAPLTMFKAIRTQMDELGFAPDHRVRSLSELPRIAEGSPKDRRPPVRPE
jgi:2-haloacid dehalogenase